MWKLKKPRKIRAKILFLSIIPVASLTFVSSCSTILIKKQEKPEKPEKSKVKKGERIKVKIKDFQFSFSVEKKHDNFGLIKVLKTQINYLKKFKTILQILKKVTTGIFKIANKNL